MQVTKGVARASAEAPGGRAADRELPSSNIESGGGAGPLVDEKGDRVAIPESSQPPEHMPGCERGSWTGATAPAPSWDGATEPGLGGGARGSHDSGLTDGDPTWARPILEHLVGAPPAAAAPPRFPGADGDGSLIALHSDTHHHVHHFRQQVTGGRTMITGLTPSKIRSSRCWGHP